MDFMRIPEMPPGRSIRSVWARQVRIGYSLALDRVVDFLSNSGDSADVAAALWRLDGMTMWRRLSIGITWLR